MLVSLILYIIEFNCSNWSVVCIWFVCTIYLKLLMFRIFWKYAVLTQDSC